METAPPGTPEGQEAETAPAAAEPAEEPETQAPSRQGPTPAESAGQGAANAAGEAGEPTPAAVPVRAASETLSTGENWPAYGGTYFGPRHPPLDQINREDIYDLERV